MRSLLQPNQILGALVALCTASAGAEVTWHHSSVTRINVAPAGQRIGQPLIEPRGGCGLVKTGTGTLVIASELKLTGVISV